ncbi:hypothetical protein Prudu_009942 [Prunus dulcis]|uniref:Uncharacterized protein n=1 Tax=Prunus dulcis TaxID=3755 RepID=A0A4Y1R7Y7_PRUDU|nr:hypothetical protein Prudu_009942 [Prunus dulcis]
MAFYLVLVPGPRLHHPHSTPHKATFFFFIKIALQNSKETDFITQVLTLRDKHSDIRILRFGSRLSFSRLNGLIRLAIRRNVQELDVEVATEDYFNFPRCVIASDSLRIFKLKSRYPGFRLPPSSVMTRIQIPPLVVAFTHCLIQPAFSLRHVRRVCFPYAQETELGRLFRVEVPSDWVQGA